MNSLNPEQYMQRCLDLARQGQGNTHPNPMVGAVVLDVEGQIVGEGFHPYYGGPHAEVFALDQAAEKACGGTLFVNLEPCSHTGKTPPCADRVIAAGVRQVYCGMVDPNPKVAGQGIRRLEEHGIAVETGILEAACLKLNEAFCHYIQTKTPFVVLKQAMTLDGRIATRSGESQWITSPAARAWVHQLRSQSDAILTTAQTIRQDNSQLTVRLAPVLGKPPVRVVLDRSLSLSPMSYALFQDIDTQGPVWVFTQSAYLNSSRAEQMRQAGAAVLAVQSTGTGLDLAEVFTVLGQHKITQLMVEAGGTLSGALLNQGLIHKLWLLYGGKLIGDPGAWPAFSGDPVFRLGDALPVSIKEVFLKEGTLIMEAYPQPKSL